MVHPHQALYVLGTGVIGAATATLGEVSHDENIKNLGMIAVAAAAFAVIAKTVLSWVLDRALKKWEALDAIPASINSMHSEVMGEFTRMRTDVQTIGTNLSIHTAADVEWKKAAVDRDIELRRRLNELERAQGWTVRGSGPTTSGG